MRAEKWTKQMTKVAYLALSKIGSPGLALKSLVFQHRKADCRSMAAFPGK